MYYGTANPTTSAPTPYVVSDGFITGDLYISISTNKAGLIWVYNGTKWTCIVQLSSSPTCPSD